MEHGRNENVKSSSASEQLEVVASGDLVGLNERLEGGLGEGCQSRSRGEKAGNARVWFASPSQQSCTSTSASP